jgi:hypothetical protein
VSRWKFVVAYLGTISEEEMTLKMELLNASSTKYTYQFRRGNGTTDWIVEKSIRSLRGNQS